MNTIHRIIFYKSIEENERIDNALVAERRAKMTPKERREEKEMEDKVTTVVFSTILFFAILFIAFIVWISHY
jgi:hypothetical protein